MSNQAVRPRRVTILGATGSVGQNTIDLIERFPDRYQVEALTGNSRIHELADMARRVRARFVVSADPKHYGKLKDALAGEPVEVAAGADALVEAAERDADWTMAAIVGAAGLRPTLAAVRRGRLVALANKECLVCAGALMVGEVRRSGATLIPADSEHNAIFQALGQGGTDMVDRLILTASGGPFRDHSRSKMARATPHEAVRHPNWSMGPKISIDSATMMNKGLELIEAHHLFGIPEDRIDILIHRQSVVHSLVNFKDGSMMAQLGAPDMRIPISHALSWPDRMDWPAPKLDLAAIASLDFSLPDHDRFPALTLARDALRAGGALPTILNAANEIAVAAFLQKRIGFLDIPAIVEETLGRSASGEAGSIADVVAFDETARRLAGDLIAKTTSMTCGVSEA